MKRPFIIFLLLLTAALGGCDQNSIENPVYGSQTTSTFYETPEEVNEALTGTYLQLRMTYNEYALYHYFLEDISTDDAWKGGASINDNIDLYNLQTYNIKATNAVVSDFWNICYKLISRANEVITYGPDVSGDSMLVNRYINEAKLLRAFGYYNLVTLYGGVPLVLKPLQPSETAAIPRSSTDEVIKQMVSDFTDATALPAKSEYDATNQYRVTSGLAYTMLGKTYMFQQKYDSALLAFKSVIDSGEYKLLDDYGANWRIKNSQESIFEMDNKLVGGDINTGTGSNVPHYFTSRNTPNYQGYGFDAPTQDLFDAFDPNDPRITYTFIMTGDRFLNDDADQDNSASPSGYAERKIFVPVYQRVGVNYMLNYDVRLIRYADVLLLYAEAANEQGQPSEALKYVNMVRERARNTPAKDPQRSKQVYVPQPGPSTLPDISTASQSQLRQTIWHERRVELGLEGWRRDDLLRQGRLGTVMKNFAQKYNSTKGGSFTQGQDELLPIPQGEIDNSNGTITQNPGF